MFLPCLFSTAVAALSLGASRTWASVIPRAAGSLSVVSGTTPFTFKYATPAPDDRNWIGIYNTYGGSPYNETYVAPSLTWKYATEAQGTLDLSASALQPGPYKAFFLAKDGYKWLAEPIDIFVPGKEPAAFLLPSFTTRAVRVGNGFEAKVGGLLVNAPDTRTQFAKVGGDEWVQVSPAGVLSGTPSLAGRSHVTVEATTTGGDKTRLEVTIPIREASAKIDQLSVLTFNLWHGGTQVNDYHRKQVQFLANSGVDIVGLQEATGGHAIRLAAALGWDFWQSNSVGIISRYPIVEVFPEAKAGGAVRVELDGPGSRVIAWNAHLGYNPYGPYDFCFDHMSTEQVMQREAESGRTPQITEIVSRMTEHLANADEVPVILTGDFNAPSHLDWTNETRDQHCRVGSTSWPTSVAPFNAGLVDSFREIHQDPVTVPGITWSPIYLNNNGRSEPLDRIDFIYHKGLKTVDSQIQIVGQPAAEPDHKDNEWTSDHAAVRSIFLIP